MTKIISWNVNGLRAAINKGFKSFISEISPTLLCLQETKLQSKHVEAHENIFDTYQSSFITAKRAGYSGVATLTNVKECLNVTHHAGIGDAYFDDEGRVLVTQFDDYTLINAYFPSGTSGELRQDYKYRFLDAFSDFVSPLLSKPKPRLIIVGDFNICHEEIDIHHPKEAEKRKLTGFLPEERAWFSKFIKLGLIDTFRYLHGDKRQYSWWSYRANSREKNLGWRIDYILTSNDLKTEIQCADILNSIKGSDHCPIVLELSKQKKL